MSFTKAIKYIFYSEFLLYIRRSQEWLYPLSFYVMVLCLIPFTLNDVLDSQLSQKILPGYFWLAALFSCIMSIQTIFIYDIEDDHLTQLTLSQIPFSFIIFSKFLATWCMTQLPLILLTPILGFILNLSLQTILFLCLTLLIGTPIIMLISMFAVALTLGLQQTGVLLSLLILPLITPVLIFGINIILQQQAGINTVGPILFLSGISVLTITLIPFVIANLLIISND